MPYSPMINENDAEQRAARIAQLKDMLSARVDMRGKPLPGFKNNVPLIKAEISRLEAQNGD